MRIRIAHPEDATLIDQLLARAYPTLMADAYEPEILSAALPFITKANGELLKSGSYYVAEESARVLGCGGWTHECPGTSETTKGIAHLRHFATDPAFARQGVGRAIFRVCAEAAVKSGANKFQVYSSLNAEPFYASLGLTRVKEIDLPMTPTTSFRTLLMEGSIEVD